MSDKENGPDKPTKHNPLVDALTEQKQTRPFDKDQQFNDDSHKARHEGSYTKILESYADGIKLTLEQKTKYKPRFFTLSYWFLLGGSLIFILLLFMCLHIFMYNKSDSALISGVTSVILSATISFLTIFIVIPKIITKYLFNSEEEKYMTEIIKSIQEYDK